MGNIQGVSYLDAQRDDHLRLDRFARDVMLERHPVQRLHHHEGVPILLADVVEGADVRMVQRRSGPGFAPEARQRVGVMGYVGRQELEGDEAAEAYVVGLVHYSHTAAAELFQDAVVRNGRTNHYVEKSALVIDSRGRV